LRFVIAPCGEPAYISIHTASGNVATESDVDFGDYDALKSG
jgi:hypothetical protein